MPSLDSLDCVVRCRRGRGRDGRHRCFLHQGIERGHVVGAFFEQAALLDEEFRALHLVAGQARDGLHMQVVAAAVAHGAQVDLLGAEVGLP